MSNFHEVGEAVFSTVMEHVDKDKILDALDVCDADDLDDDDLIDKISNDGEIATYWNNTYLKGLCVERVTSKVLYDQFLRLSAQERAEFFVCMDQDYTGPTRYKQGWNDCLSAITEAVEQAEQKQQIPQKKLGQPTAVGDLHAGTHFDYRGNTYVLLEKSPTTAFLKDSRGERLSMSTACIVRPEL